MHLIDWSVVALYLAAMLGLAGWLGRRQRSGGDYFWPVEEWPAVA